MTQLDMFAMPLPVATPKRPRAAPLPPLFPRRIIAWERLLEAATCTDITVLVSTLWTGVVLETLSDPQLGRRFLHADGTIQIVEPDTAHGRTIFLTVDQASALHQRWPLLKLGASGTHSARFELAPTADPVDTDTLATLARLEEET